MNKKILIVDNDFNIRLLLNRILRCFRQHEVDLLFAEGGEEALEIAFKNEPNLVFLDIMMPGLDGFDVCKELKKMYHLKNTQVIFVTAKDQQWDIDKAKELGADDYIIKPICVQTRLLRRLKLLWISK